VLNIRKRRKEVDPQRKRRKNKKVKNLRKESLIRTKRNPIERRINLQRRSLKEKKKLISPKLNRL